MLKNYTSLSLMFLFLFLYSSYSQTTTISDSNFEQALIDLGIDTDGLNGSVTTADISSITYLNVSSKNISNLKGIEDFINLNYLVCSSNQLTSLDLSQNTNLIELTCNNNQL